MFESGFIRAFIGLVCYAIRVTVGTALQSGYPSNGRALVFGIRYPISIGVFFTQMEAQGKAANVVRIFVIWIA